MGTKYLPLNDRLYDYLTAFRSDVADPILAALRKETAALGEVAVCQISDEEGMFLRILAALIGTKSAVEVGTFTGYSSLCIARGMGAGGKLLCLDYNAEWTSIARKYWKKAGVANKIELRIGPAIPALKKLPKRPLFDLAFIDADKEEYDAYYEEILPRTRKNGLILFDNMLWHGRIIGREARRADSRAITALNRKLARDRRVETVLIPVADGIQVCRKK